MAARRKRGTALTQASGLSRGGSHQSGRNRSRHDDGDRSGRDPQTNDKTPHKREEKSTRSTIARTIGTTGCECRKPKPGLLFQAQKELHLDLSRTLFIGDDERDRAGRRAAGCPFLKVHEEDYVIQDCSTGGNRQHRQS